MAKIKSTNNDLQNTTQKTKDRAKRTPQNTTGELRVSGRVCSSCSIAVLHFIVKVESPTLNKSRTLKWVWNGPYPEVQFLSIIIHWDCNILTESLASKANPTKHYGWTQGLRKGMQFLLHMLHLLCTPVTRRWFWSMISIL
jgi:hypothetical protein